MKVNTHGQLIVKRGGKRKGAGRPTGSIKKPYKVLDTEVMTVLRKQFPYHVSHDKKDPKMFHSSPSETFCNKNKNSYCRLQKLGKKNGYIVSLWNVPAAANVEQALTAGNFLAVSITVNKSSFIKIMNSLIMKNWRQI